MSIATSFGTSLIRPRFAGPPSPARGRRRGRAFSARLSRVAGHSTPSARCIHHGTMGRPPPTIPPASTAPSVPRPPARPPHARPAARPQQARSAQGRVPRRRPAPAPRLRRLLPLAAQREKDRRADPLRHARHARMVARQTCRAGRELRARGAARSTPCIYPFIVNNPGEAAQAKRRSAAVTIGHLTPPLVAAGAHGAALEIETLFDEYAAAEQLDPKRAKRSPARSPCAPPYGASPAEAGVDLATGQPALAALDAWLCDIKRCASPTGCTSGGGPPMTLPRRRHGRACPGHPRRDIAALSTSKGAAAPLGWPGQARP